MIWQKYWMVIFAQDKNKYVVVNLFQMQFTMLKSHSHMHYIEMCDTNEKNNFWQLLDYVKIAIVYVNMNKYAHMWVGCCPMRCDKICHSLKIDEIFIVFRKKRGNWFGLFYFEEIKWNRWKIAINLRYRDWPKVIVSQNIWLCSQSVIPK